MRAPIFRHSAGRAARVNPLTLLGGATAAAVAAALAMVVVQSRTSAAPAPTTARATAPAGRARADSSSDVLMMPATPMDRRLVVPRPMASDFLVLRHRSIFIHGQQTHDPDENRTFTEPASFTRPESMLIFNGVANVNGQLAAFFEDNSSHDVIVRRVGDPLAQGHITHITLNSIDYDSNGHTTHVAIGQSLDGGAGASLANQPTAGTGSNGASTGGDSILDRLRRRRQQELGH